MGGSDVTGRGLSLQLASRGRCVPGALQWWSFSRSDPRCQHPKGRACLREGSEPHRDRFVRHMGDTGSPLWALRFSARSSCSSRASCLSLLHSGTSPRCPPAPPGGAKPGSGASIGPDWPPPPHPRPPGPPELSPRGTRGPGLAKPARVSGPLGGDRDGVTVGERGSPGAGQGLGSDRAAPPAQCPQVSGETYAAEIIMYIMNAAKEQKIRCEYEPSSAALQMRTEGGWAPGGSPPPPCKGPGAKPRPAALGGKTQASQSAYFF